MRAEARKTTMTLGRVACVFALQCLLPASGMAAAREYFNPALLGIDGPGKDITDLTAFENGLGQMPGTYYVDIIVNNASLGARDIHFIRQQDGNGEDTLVPCLSVATLKAFGLRTRLFPQLAGTGQCARIAAIPQATTRFEFNRQQLIFTFPQAAMATHARGYVAPERLDEGITALLLNYSFSGANARTRQSGQADTDSDYLNLHPGINLGPWRVRNYSTWTRNATGSETQAKWDSVYTFVQRDILFLQGQLTAGDSSSPADMFDGVPFRGIQLASDDDMLPDSLRGYAPVIRGIARSNAQVIVRQNGYTIYQTWVSPGAFQITDMYPTGSSGDLDVIVREADGSEQHQVVPYASLPVLQREGRVKYSVTGGQYRPYENDVAKARFAQATAIYGLPAGYTVYGGGQLATHYTSLLVGLGKNIGEFGAVSLDSAQAWSEQKVGGRARGRSLRLRYSKNMLSTGTQLTLAGYRYSSSGYDTLQDTLDTWRERPAQQPPTRRRNRAELMINQNLGENAGSLSLTAVRENDWNSDRNMRSLSVGYSNSWRGMTWNLNYSDNRNTSDGSDHDSGTRSDQIFSLSLNVPLALCCASAWASYSLNTSKHGDTLHMVGLNGTALEENNLNWSVQESKTNHGQGNGGNASLDYQGTYARVNAAYGYDPDQRRVNYGIEGSVVAHAHGVTFGQPLGETVALVEAPGVNGVDISNQTGVRTDFRGYTLVPSITPYRNDDIVLDTNALPEDADVTLNAVTVTPTRGAIVRAHFETHIGKRVLLTLIRRNGARVPFGATVARDMPPANAAIVGDNGQVYLSGMPDQGSATARWGRNDNAQCRIHWQLPESVPASGVVEMTIPCQ